MRSRRNIFLVFYREFYQKVSNKLFIISTFAVPFGIAIFYLAIYFLSSDKFNNSKIGLVSESENLKKKLISINENYQIIENNVKLDKEIFKKQNLDAIIILKNIDNINFSAKILFLEKLGVVKKDKISKDLNIIKSNIIIEKLNSIYSTNKISDIDIKFQNFEGKEDKNFKESISYGLGLILGGIIYVLLTIYGSQVMRSVMEEKITKVAEVLISSIKPFELLLGKILAISLICFLQIFIWTSLIFIFKFIYFSFYSTQIDIANQISSFSNTYSLEDINNIIVELRNVNFPLIISFFIIYLILGFFLYSTLFASIGVAVNDDSSDIQVLIIPVLMPIFLSFILLTYVVNNPNSMISKVTSILPFTSPVIMPSRIVFGIGDSVTVFEIILSLVILIISIIFLLFLASRIYRVGILMYGVKPSFKNILNWMLNPDR